MRTHNTCVMCISSARGPVELCQQGSGCQALPEAVPHHCRSLQRKCVGPPSRDCDRENTTRVLEKIGYAGSSFLRGSARSDTPLGSGCQALPFCAASLLLALWCLCTSVPHNTLMILPQVHLRKPCYDFYFL
ncbi:hypothetical protein J6590_087394 [Homalodisca vitripennis]|nr:hypothetical protein J6590_087394 [Homalodisca vitripennis]